MASISRLDVRNFRGIPNQAASLTFGQKSVLLFGEKGAGKSSFVDAIEKVLCGRVSSSDGRAWPTHPTYQAKRSASFLMTMMVSCLVV
jgi:DNA repair ATPase RecN